MSLFSSNIIYMRKLSKNENIAVGVALVVAFGMLFYGNTILQAVMGPSQSSSPEVLGATTSGEEVDATIYRKLVGL